MKQIALLLLLLANAAMAADTLEKDFTNPPDSARPWVYWEFQDGHLTREGMKADLEAMQKAGIGGALYQEVSAMGIPKGPVEFMSPKWQDLIVGAMRDCDRLGLEFSLSTGPGWCGAGGPWIDGDHAMQYLVPTATTLKGGQHVEVVLPQPEPRRPAGFGAINEKLLKDFQQYYRDEKVIAYPYPRNTAPLREYAQKALYARGPYSGRGSKAYLSEDPSIAPPEACIDPNKVIDLTGKMSPDGKLVWDAPAGNWTVMRWGRTLTGQTTRPAPMPGLGFEVGKFEVDSMDRHFASYLAPLIEKLGGDRHADRGWTTLHWDSWEVGTQNWSETFAKEFKQRRGYDPTPWLPAMAGQIVGSVALTERFLWDMRRTAQQLMLENHIGRIKSLGVKSGFKLTIEPYDMNPNGDLALGSEADTPSAEFWSRGFDTLFSVFEAVSCAHTTGRKVVQAEAFTSTRDAWLSHPGSIKDLGDFAFCAGVNRFCFCRWSPQPEANPKPPGLPWGQWGIHWERTQTWWDMVTAYHSYLTRCQALLQKGLPVVDILFLDNEDAPNVFRAPASATLPGQPDKKGYSFDGCAPGVLIKNASVKDGKIVFPDGMSYRILVLPQKETMTPELLRKVQSLVEAGALVYGRLPSRSPSLQDYPKCDEEIAGISKALESSGKMIVDRSPLPVTDPILDAHWIWTNEEGNPRISVPAGTRFFQYAFLVDRPVESASCVITADKHFDLTVNGKNVGCGENGRSEFKFDLGSLLKPGTNTIQVTVRNDKAGPGGLIAAIRARLEGGKKLSINTDKTWKAGAYPMQGMTPAREVGTAGSPPRILAYPLNMPNLYPDYDSIAKILAGRGVVPDFATDGDLRYIHRVDGDTDYYFVGNRKAEKQEVKASFRVTGKQPELWDPLTGSTRPLPEYSEANGVTTIPMSFAPTQSFFVVFRPKAGAVPAKGENNFPDDQPLLSLEGGWQVSFDPKRGGPEGKVSFEKLDDWISRAEKGIKYYSGTAVYEKTFDLANPPQKGCKLNLGKVAVMAEVTLNGKNLGIVWCPPWQVDVPTGVLKEKGNNLEIKVANLWPNRLIGDAALPASERVTDLGGSSINFYGAKDRLQSSGLLGPVKLLAFETEK